MAGARETKSLLGRIRWVAVAYYLGAGLFGVWIMGSIVVHLFGSRKVVAAGKRIDARAGDKLQVYQCWWEVDRAFRELLRDFGRNVSSLSRPGFDPREAWQSRYGWDVVPVDQFPSGRLDRENLGPWRWRLLKVRSSCRLDEPEVVARSRVLALLAEVLPLLDGLRVSLTGYVRLLAGHEAGTRLGGEAKQAEEVRVRLGRARRALRRVFHGRLPTGLRTRGRKGR